MKLAEYLEGMARAQTIDELEAAIQADQSQPFHGRTWDRICKARIEAGQRIVDAHPNGRYVPRFGPRRRLTVCGQTCGVAKGGNTTGVRYAWHCAGEWAMGLLRAEGFSKRAAYRIWEWWGTYPHRALRVVEEAMAGKHQDPPLNVLIRNRLTGYGKPINYSVERNKADALDRRASRPCECGGTLFDWGAGFSEGFDYVNWHCNACPDVFTEYLPVGGLALLRSGARQKDLAP